MKRKFYGIETNKRLCFNYDKFRRLTRYANTYYGYNDPPKYDEQLNRLNIILKTLKKHLNNEDFDEFTYEGYIENEKLIISDNDDEILYTGEKVKLHTGEGIVLKRIYDIGDNSYHYYTNIEIDTGIDYITDQNKMEMNDYVKNLLQNEIDRFKRLIEMNLKELKEIEHTRDEAFIKKENKLMKKLKKFFQNPLRK
ncbi:hypothetical protein [Bacillus mojavensis]